ncbi:MAG: porin OmpL1, partial [Leptospiraceae bacterium]|nr:porin OmpL1 [Leptospiraceae bacterium]
MIRKISVFLSLSIIGLVLGTSLSAKPRVIIGAGLQFDPNSLGGTFVKDGLDSGVTKKDDYGNYAGVQKIFIAENKLQTLENLTGGMFNYKTNGPMTAGSLTLGFENDLYDEGKNGGFFYRVGLNLSTVVSGGHKTATFMGYKWYDARWFYKSMVIPAFLGIKLDAGPGSFYMAPGVHWYKAEWQVKGTIDGYGIEQATGGMSKKLPVVGDAMNPSAYNEDAKFDGSGMGFSWLIGVQTKITDSGYAFFELETHSSYTI